MVDTGETEVNFTKDFGENQLLNYLFPIGALQFLAAKTLVHCPEDLFLLNPEKSN